MPTYEYRCAACDDVFEEQRPMARSSEPATCPQGHTGARRVLSVFAAVTGSAGVAAGPMASGSAGPSAPGCGGGCACH